MAEYRYPINELLFAVNPTEESAIQYFKDTHEAYIALRRRVHGIDRIDVIEARRELFDAFAARFTNFGSTVMGDLLKRIT